MPGLVFQHPLRDSSPYSVFNCIYYPPIKSSISRPAVKTKVRTLTVCTVLYKWQNLNIALDLCYYQLRHKYLLLVPFKFANCSPFGGHISVGAKTFILLSIT